IHVSTAYVGGISKGLRQEGKLAHDVDGRAEYQAAQEARQRVEAESRRPETLGPQIRSARSPDGRRAPKAGATATQAARRARAARHRGTAESRRPGPLRSRMRWSRSRDGGMGPKAVATASEEARRAWVDERLVDFGRTRAQSVGWTEIYTFTKAMAERVAEDL